MTAEQEASRIKCQAGSSNEIQIQNGFGDRYVTKSFRFSGGELQVEIPGYIHARGAPGRVIARIQSSEDLIRLMLATEILARNSHDQHTLIVPYFPYARQDRITQALVSFSLKPVAYFINMLGYENVVIVDPHSDVVTALLGKVTYIPQTGIVREHAHLNGRVHSNTIVVAPDAGATKKAMEVAKVRGSDFLSATKVRDVQTGEIKDINLGYEVPVLNRDCLIVDDICDGGRTFTELAQVLRHAGARKIYLYVTHGIFSKGLSVFDGLIDEIFTTDSFLSPYIDYENATNLYVQKVVEHLR